MWSGNINSAGILLLQKVNGWIIRQWAPGHRPIKGFPSVHSGCSRMSAEHSAALLWRKKFLLPSPWGCNIMFMLNRYDETNHSIEAGSVHKVHSPWKSSHRWLTFDSSWRRVSWLWCLETLHQLAWGNAVIKGQNSKMWKAMPEEGVCVCVCVCAIWGGCLLCGCAWGVHVPPLCSITPELITPCCPDWLEANPRRNISTNMHPHTDEYTHTHTHKHTHTHSSHSL